ncbi:ABC transporter ATP-binding protein [Streptomyces xiamenensis]|uniref:ABC transporter ATP-binding protein n=1 Tax=Streptomyces xiamenensis TaxID=408015 RepID=UPI0035DD30EC
MSIEFSNCTFGYLWKRPIFSDLNLTFADGRTVLLGENGAGKSTLLSLAASTRLPNRGSVRYGHRETNRRSDQREYRKLIAWMPQDIKGIRGLSAREQVAYFAWLKGLSRSDAWERSLTALEVVDLKNEADKKVHHLSGGQLRRVGIAQAIAHDAQVYLLDEPTAGLDPLQRRNFHAVITRISRDASVIVSTHDISDLDEEYDNVIVIRHGRIVFQGEVSQFLEFAPTDVAPGRRAEHAYAAFCQGASR